MSDGGEDQMSKSKPTPGPWVVNGFGGEFKPVARLLPREVVVSSESIAGDEIANARLIAAAPDLLRALKLALPALGALETFDVARDAIEKAEGTK